MKLKSYFKKLKFINYKLNIINRTTKTSKIVLKQKIKIINKLNKLNKKLLFIGTSKKFNIFLLNLKLKTKHSYIPEKLWLNGVLTNQSIFKHLFFSRSKLLNFLFNLKHINNFNLIILFNEIKFKNQLLKAKIPFLIFNNINNKNLFYYFLIYKILKNVL